MSESTRHHRLQAGRCSAQCAVLTISDTRKLETDERGGVIVDLLTQAGHVVIERAICPDEPARIAAQLEDWLGREELQVVLTTGGTGIARRDTTVEIVDAVLTAKLDGFGELFRMLSWDEIGAAAMLSRATAGLVARPADEGGDSFIFAMPGSVAAIQLAMTKLILPELAHLLWERRGR